MLDNLQLGNVTLHFGFGDVSLRKVSLFFLKSRWLG